MRLVLLGIAALVAASGCTTPEPAPPAPSPADSTYCGDFYSTDDPTCGGAYR